MKKKSISPISFIFQAQVKKAKMSNSPSSPPSHAQSTHFRISNWSKDDQGTQFNFTIAGRNQSPRIVSSGVDDKQPNVLKYSSVADRQPNAHVYFASNYLGLLQYIQIIIIQFQKI